VEVQRTGRRELIDYDVAGSVVGIRTDTATAVPWTVRPGNVLTRAGDVEFEVDENRRRVRRIEAGGAVTQYVWDCRDRLREVRLPDGTRARYTYDVHGRRLRKDIVPPAVTTLEETQAPVRSIRYVWDGTVLAAEIDSERGTRVFVHHPGTFVPMLQQEQGEVFTYVTDPLGTPKELIDERGEIAWAATHSAWGAVVEQTAVGGARRLRPVASPFRLLGQYHDEETGLSYTLMRYFDAETARWLSPDPLGLVGGRNLASFNGSPVAHVDPMGLQCIIGNPALDDVMLAALGIPKRPGYYDVVVHGSPFGVSIKDERGNVIPITPRQLALLIMRQKDYNGEPIRLLSCSTGKEDHGFAQQLAWAMGKNVEAPKRDMSPVEHDKSEIMNPFSPDAPRPPPPPDVAKPAMVVPGSVPEASPSVAPSPVMPATAPGSSPAPPAMVPPGGWLGTPSMG
jgi:RHS repeat-associated protein